MFYLGVITGIILAFGAIYSFFWLVSVRKVKNLIDILEVKAENKLPPTTKKQKVQFIPSPDEQAEALGAVIEENDKRGRDTPLEDYL